MAFMNACFYRKKKKIKVRVLLDISASKFSSEDTAALRMADQNSGNDSMETPIPEQSSQTPRCYSAVQRREAHPLLFHVTFSP